MLGMTFAAFAVASPSAIAAASQSCAHVTGTATLTPGLTSTPTNQTATAHATMTTCTPTTTTGGSNVTTATLKIPLGSCAKLATGNQKFSGTATTTWHNAKKSVSALTFTTGTGSNITVATITGKVSSGLFAGHLVSGQVKFSVKSGENCTAGHPIKDLTFVGTKPFVVS
jgi:hypothetical protein